MSTPNLADRVVFWTAASFAFLLYSQALYQYGFDHGREYPKKCAAVEGHEVVSTTHDSCTYARSYGRATTRRKI